MIAEGLGNKEIASKLRISDHTVKFHIAQSSPSRRLQSHRGRYHRYPRGFDYGVGNGGRGAALNRAMTDEEVRIAHPVADIFAGDIPGLVAALPRYEIRWKLVRGKRPFNLLT